MTIRRIRSAPWLGSWWLIAALMGAFSLSVVAQGTGEVEVSSWWQDLERLEGDLQAGKWKKAAKEAPRLGREITALSWYHPELPKVFAEVALYEAIAAANLERDEHAIWMWHVAQNIDRAIRDRDLAPYGRAAKLLYEHPLRARGEVPFRWRAIPRGPIYGTSLIPPRHQEGRVKPVILSSHAVKLERRKVLRPVHIELIVDEHGRPHQPIITFPPDVHPAIKLAVLRHIPDREVEPARLDGNAVPFLTTIEHHFDIIRGSSRSNDFSRVR